RRRLGARQLLLGRRHRRRAVGGALGQGGRLLLRGGQLLGRGDPLRLQALDALREPGPALLELVAVRARALDRGAQRGELAAHLGVLAAGGGHPVAPVLVEAAAPLLELALGLGERLCVDEERLAVALDLLRLGAQLRPLRLERRDDRRVDRRGELALHPAAPLGEQREEPAAPLAELLVAPEGVADVAVAERGELRLGR